MALQTFTDWLLSRPETPSFMKTPYGLRLMGIVGYLFDSLTGGLNRAFIAGLAHPEAPSDGLDLQGIDCQLPRYPVDTDTTYAARLKGKWNTWSTSGSKAMLEAELAKFGYPNAYIVGNQEWDGTEIRLPIDNLSGFFEDGESITIDGGTYTADVVTAHRDYLRVKNLSGTPNDNDTILGDSSGATALQDGTLTTESRPEWALQADIDNWSRFWIYFPHDDHTWTSDGNWDDPGVWDDGGVWDYEGITFTEVRKLKALIERHRPAHEIPVLMRFLLEGGVFTAPDTFDGDSIALFMYN